MANQTKASNQKSHQKHANERSGRTSQAEFSPREGEGMITRGLGQVDDMVLDHEGRAILTALAAGFGIGYVLGCMLAGSESRPKNWSDRIAAEGLGRRVMEGLDRMLPEAISSRLGN